MKHIREALEAGYLIKQVAPEFGISAQQYQNWKKQVFKCDECNQDAMKGHECDVFGGKK